MLVKLFRTVILFSALTIVFVVSALIVTPNVASATGCWIGCRLPNGTEVPGSPGNMSGCSVQYAGHYIFLESVGVYEYTCSGRVTTCYYDYSGSYCLVGGLEN